MKTKIITNTETETGNKYPYCGVWRDTCYCYCDYRFIVLFTGPKTGIVIHSEHPNHEVGKYGGVNDESVTWNESEFELFEGIIKFSK